MSKFNDLYSEVKKMCGWETIPTELNLALGRVCQPADIQYLIAELESLDNAALEDDAGDEADYYWRLRTSISDALVAAGKLAVKPLLAAIDSPNDAAAEYVARSLSLLKVTQAITPILKRLNGARDNQAKLPYISALGEIGDRSVIDDLLPYLQKSGELNGGWLVRLTAIALGKIGDKSSIEPLGCLLRSDPDWFARLGAAEGLRNLVSKASIVHLEFGTTDSDQRVAQAAQESLRAVKRQIGH